MDDAGAAPPAGASMSRGHAAAHRTMMPNTSEIAMIEAAGLGKKVSTGSTERTILQVVSFRVRAGEAVAVVGVSGSGRATLLVMLAGLDTPPEGSVLIEGRDNGALDEDG